MSYTFSEILAAWSRGDSYTDVYHMILYWSESKSPLGGYPLDIVKLIGDWQCRAYSGDETHNLVDDFLYGEEYAPLREYFAKPDQDCQESRKNAIGK